MAGHELPSSSTEFRQRRQLPTAEQSRGAHSSVAPSSLDGSETQEPEKPRTLLEATKDFFERWRGPLCIALGSFVAGRISSTDFTPSQRAILGIPTVAVLTLGTLEMMHNVHRQKEELREVVTTNLEMTKVLRRMIPGVLVEQQEGVRPEDDDSPPIYTRTAGAGFLPPLSSRRAPSSAPSRE
jgi:hypothetical protein